MGQEPADAHGNGLQTGLQDHRAEEGRHRPRKAAEEVPEAELERMLPSTGNPVKRSGSEHLYS